MAIDSSLRVTPSVFDRLIDLDPRTPSESPKSRTATLVDLKLSVLRDLEWLLSTRQSIYSREGLEEALGSVAFYGLPDFTAMGALSPVEFRKFFTDLENCIHHFEPRIFDVEITFEPVTSTDRQVRFRIDASLDVDPTPEPIAFDSILSPGDGKITIISR
jgi:type VI secretion system protein ImpF